MFWTFSVLGTIKPKYNNNNKPKAIRETKTKKSDFLSILDYPILRDDDQNAYSWDIQINIASKSMINFIECPNYKLNT